VEGELELGHEMEGKFKLGQDVATKAELRLEHTDEVELDRR